MTTPCYEIECKTDIEGKNWTVSKTSNGRKILLRKCAVSKSRKSRFIKKQEPIGLLSQLGIRTSLKKIPFLGDFLF